MQSDLKHKNIPQTSNTVFYPKTQTYNVFTCLGRFYVCLSGRAYAVLANCFTDGGGGGSTLFLLLRLLIVEAQISVEQWEGRRGFPLDPDSSSNRTRNRR